MRTKIVAEAANNHNGDVELAKEMIWRAKECGADYIKFQGWRLKDASPQDPDYERWKAVELSDEAHRLLREECRKAEIGYIITCFDYDRIPFLVELAPDAVKVASYDICSYQTIAELARHFPTLILSTGCATEEMLQKVAGIPRGKDFTLLHCVTLYPAPAEMANLKRMDWLRKFSPSVGLSDHTLGTTAAKIAISRGADYVEKHFTLDKGMPGRFQALSTSPSELREIVEFAHEAEDMLRERHEFSAEEVETWNRYRCRLGKGL